MNIRLAESPLDLDRLNRLFLTELHDFRRGFDDVPVPAEQDLRAGAIAWVALFAPEAVDEEARRRLSLTCEATRELPDYDHHGWYRAVYLDVAQYALTGEPRWLSTIVSNIDHHSSQLRTSLHAPLGLVAPALALPFGELRQRIENNLRSAHFYNESLMCLFCVLQTEPAVKLAQAIRWRDDISLAPQDADRLDRLISGKLLSNALIAKEYGEITRYLACRLLDRALTDSPVERPGGSLGLSSRALTLNALWQRVAAHPLNAPLVSLPRST